jgi:hypothetical protein
MSKHSGSTDKSNSVKLESSIERVIWTSGDGSPGAKAGIEVNTHFIGNNSEMKIELSDKSGKVLETVKGKISGNRFWTEITIPEKAKDELYAEVKLSKHGLSKKSNKLYLYPPVQIKNLKWDKKEARRGDILKISADVLNFYEGGTAEIQIWEYDSDKAHDLVTKFKSTIKSQKLEADWEFQYVDDTDDIPTADETEKGYNPPEYFFRIIAGGISADSEILKFLDSIEIKLVDNKGNALPDKNYKLILPDSTKKEGKTDSDGNIKLDDLPPGKIRVELVKD